MYTAVIYYENTTFNIDNLVYVSRNQLQIIQYVKTI